MCQARAASDSSTRLCTIVYKEADVPDPLFPAISNPQNFIPYHPFIHHFLSLRWKLTMFWYPYFVTVASALPYALASPIGRIDTSQDTAQYNRNRPLSTRAWSWTLGDLAAEFKGIHWDYAFSDCTPDQLDKVIFSTRAAQWMLDLVEEDDKFPYSAAWNRYFGDYPLWYKSGARFLAVAAQIQRQYNPRL